LRVYLLEQCLKFILGTLVKTRNFVTFYKFLSHLGVHHTPINCLLGNHDMIRQPMVTRTRSKQQAYEDTNNNDDNRGYGCDTLRQGGRAHESYVDMTGTCQGNAEVAGPIEPSHGQSSAHTQHPPTTQTQHSYSGIAEVLGNVGWRLKDNRVIANELKWQNQVATNKEKQKGLQEEALQCSGFNLFLFMTKRSCFVCMGHSLAKFESPNPTVQEVDKKVITFIGNRCARQEPTAVILPQKA
jgi:hypothetical protein